MHAIERSLETRLRAVVDEVFRPLPRNSGVQAAGVQAAETDELNLTGDAWTQIGFRIQAVLPEFESDFPEEDECGEIRATSADGLHRIKLTFFPWLADTCRVEVQYVGPQRFRTVEGRADWHVAEFQREAPVPRALHLKITSSECLQPVLTTLRFLGAEHVGQGDLLAVQIQRQLYGRLHDSYYPVTSCQISQYPLLHDDSGTDARKLRIRA